MGESLVLAESITATKYEDLPADAVTAAKKSLLDGLGVMLGAGTLGEGCRHFVDVAVAAGGRNESTIIGFGTKVSAYMAAFANGSLAHALDFEDTHDRAMVHPNAAAIPASLALAQSIEGITGKDIITALAVGSDLVCRLGMSLKIDPIEYGWYMPPVLGAFGATAAVGKLLGLTPGQMVDAFSLTLCQATCSAELTRSPQSVVRGIRDAFAAKTGLLSAMLAKEGVTGFERPFEGEAGLFRLYARQDYDLSQLTAGLGKTFEGANVSYKPWPSCRGTHPFIETTIETIGKNGLKPEDIRQIQVRTSEVPVNRVLCEPLERKQAPQTAIDAKFSIPFVIGVAAVYGQVGLAHFTPEGLKDTGVVKVSRKVSCEVDGSLKPVQGFINIITGDDVLTAGIPEFAYGHPLNTLSQESLVQKFRDCAAYAARPVSRDKQERLAETVLHLEEVESVAEVELF